MKYNYMCVLILIGFACSPEERQDCAEPELLNNCEELYSAVSRELTNLKQSIDNLYYCLNDTDCERVGQTIVCGDYSFNNCATNISKDKVVEFKNGISAIGRKYCGCATNCNRISSCDAGSQMCNAQNACY